MASKYIFFILSPEFLFTVSRLQIELRNLENFMSRIDFKHIKIGFSFNELRISFQTEASCESC